MTPLERPEVFAGKAVLTPAEAVEYERGYFERGIARNGEVFRQLQADFNETWLEPMTLDRRRTSLIVDPPTGLLPPLIPAARDRLRAVPSSAYENPETAGLIERCLVAMRGATSQASPPIIPNGVFSPYYEIVQTPDYVLILSEWVHDARIIRMNGTHLPKTVAGRLSRALGRANTGG
jgi:hypothetical protein